MLIIQDATMWVGKACQAATGALLTRYSLLLPELGHKLNKSF